MKRNALGLRLLELRQQHNLTQKQLCSELNIGRSTYSYFETGTRTPDIETLLLIARYYDVSLDALVNDTEEDREEHTLEMSDIDRGISMIHHLKAKHISEEKIMDLSKRDFDFLVKFRDLSESNQEELIYLMNYKLRKQEK